MIKSRTFLIILIVITLLIVLLWQSISSGVTVWASFLFLLIAIISIFNIGRAISYASFSLNLMHWFFVLAFFFIAPILQINTGFCPWGISMESDEIVATNYLILLWIAFYLLGSNFGKRVKTRKQRKAFTITADHLRFFLFITILSGSIVIIWIGATNLFTRSEMGSALSTRGDSTAVSLLLDKIPRSAIAFTEAVFLAVSRKKPQYKLMLWTNSVFLLLACFPLALARNASGSIYFGLLVFYFYRNLASFRKSILYIVLFFGGFLVLFPLVNVFRTLTFQSDDLGLSLLSMLGQLRSVYSSENYDAYAMITAARQYTSLYGATAGWQLLGAMLFFIPRSIWRSKPIGSGATIAYMGRWGFTNVSCPLIAEGYINFGIAGVILFAFSTGAICAHLDKKYWDSVLGVEGFTYLKLIYPFLVPSFFFMMRGDLMSSWAYTSAYIVVFYILCYVRHFHLGKRY